jgi:hypothetical protein
MQQNAGVMVLLSSRSDPEYIAGATGWTWENTGTTILNVYTDDQLSASFVKPDGVKYYSSSRSRNATP